MNHTASVGDAVLLKDDMVTIVYTEEATIFLSIYCRVYWLHMTSKHMRGEKQREKKQI